MDPARRGGAGHAVGAAGAADNADSWGRWFACTPELSPDPGSMPMEFMRHTKLATGPGEWALPRLGGAKT
jgi:hypothetical protein